MNIDFRIKNMTTSISKNASDQLGREQKIREKNQQLFQSTQEGSLSDRPDLPGPALYFRKTGGAQERERYMRKSRLQHGTPPSEDRSASPHSLDGESPPALGGVASN